MTKASVWFEIVRADEHDLEQPDLVTVSILDLPIATYHQATETYEGIIREFRLVVAAEDQRTATPPARLLEVIATLDARFSGFSITQSAELDDAVAGTPSIDLTYDLPRGRFGVRRTEPAARRDRRLLRTR